MATLLLLLFCVYIYAIMCAQRRIEWERVCGWLVGRDTESLLRALNAECSAIHGKLDIITSIVSVFLFLCICVLLAACIFRFRMLNALASMSAASLLRPH